MSEEIGKFYLKEEQWHFKGDTAESAKVFINDVKRMFKPSTPPNNNK